MASRRGGGVHSIWDRTTPAFILSIPRTCGYLSIFVISQHSQALSFKYIILNWVVLYFLNLSFWGQPYLFIIWYIYIYIFLDGILIDWFRNWRSFWISHVWVLHKIVRDLRQSFSFENMSGLWLYMAPSPLSLSICLSRDDRGGAILNTPSLRVNWPLDTSL